MPADFVSRAEGRHDVVIVGGGTAGCVLASRLSENPACSVLVLEAGHDSRRLEDLPVAVRRHPDESVASDVALWTYAVDLVRSPRRSAHQFRGRMLGGSSAVNGSLFMRGLPEDYDAWGSPLWRFDKVLPYFRKLEHDVDFHDEFHGDAGPIAVWRNTSAPLPPVQAAFYEAALQLAVREKPDLSHPAGDGIGRMPMNNHLGMRTSMALAYLEPVRDRPNLTVIPDSSVRRILFKSGRAIGVEMVHDGRESIVHADEIILSAGTFGSPHLLLVSGVGPADELQSLGVEVVRDLPGVGRSLACHPGVVVPFRLQSEQPPDPDTPKLGLVHSTDGSADRNDVMISPRLMAGHLSVVVGLRLPVSRGRLRLCSADPAAKPSIDYGYLDAVDLAKLRLGVRRAVQIAAQLPLGVHSEQVAAAEAEDRLERWIPEHLFTADHASGTCRLGPADDPLSVVDDECRVRGLEGLRVVDLSIVPRPVRAGPYPTVVMLAERAAELIRA